MKELISKHWLSTCVVVAAVLSLAVIWALPSMESASLTQMSAVSLFVSLMRFVVAVTAVFCVLRLLDRVGAFDWRNIYNGIEADAISCAVYFGLRFLAVAYLAGVCLS